MKIEIRFIQISNCHPNPSLVKVHICFPFFGIVVLKDDGYYMKWLLKFTKFNCNNFKFKFGLNFHCDVFHGVVMLFLA